MQEKCRNNFLFAVDPSLTATGWVLFALTDGMPLAGGIISAPGTGVPMADRLSVLQSEVHELFVRLRMGAGDILVCEGPAPLVLNPSSAIKVERVRSIFEAVAREMDVQVPGRVNPRTVQSELLQLRGRQLPRREVKEAARVVVRQLYGDYLLKLPLFGVGTGTVPGARRIGKSELSQDIVDAMLIGTLALTRVREAAQAQTPLESLFASRMPFAALARRP